MASPRSLLRRTPSPRLLLALATLVAADDREAAWIAAEKAGGKTGWRAALGSVDVSCTFDARLDIDTKTTTPALVFRTSDGRFAFMGDASGAEFAKKPRLCRFAGGAAPDGKPALVLAAVTVKRIFASWPKFLNALVYAAARKLPIYLWVGEAPAPHLGDVCKEAKHDDDPHTKIAATSVLLGHPRIPAAFARDLDLVVEGRAVRDPMAATYDALEIHHENRVDVAVPCTAHSGRHRLCATKLYVRDVPAARNFLDLWLDHQCGAERWYHPLRDAAYRAGVEGGCLKSEGARAVANRTLTTKQPALNYLFRRCPAFRFGCGHHFVMPEFHVRAQDEASGASDLERLGLAGLDHDRMFGASWPLVVGGAV